MDRIAQTIGVSPVEIRRRNFLKTGQTTTTDQTVHEPIDLDTLLDRALELSGYAAKRKRFVAQNETSTQKKGMGIATFLHGAGFTGSGERYLSSLVAVEDAPKEPCACWCRAPNLAREPRLSFRRS